MYGVSVDPIVASDLPDVRDRIMRYVVGGAGLAQIERELIAPAAISEDERAALWLLAWCKHDHLSGRL